MVESMAVGVSNASKSLHGSKRSGRQKQAGSSRTAAASTDGSRTGRGPEQATADAEQLSPAVAETQPPPPAAPCVASGTAKKKKKKLKLNQSPAELGGKP